MRKSEKKVTRRKGRKEENIDFEILKYLSNWHMNIRGEILIFPIRRKEKKIKEKETKKNEADEKKKKS